MGKTIIDLQEEEKLSVAVYMNLIVLYDKSQPGFKERDRVANAWKCVEETLGLPGGKSFLLCNLSLYFVTIGLFLFFCNYLYVHEFIL